MIFLKKIEIINFLSHKNSIIDFKENQRLLISGMSGSGKSSVIEGIVWCLYGKGRSENKNLIKSGSKSATVILTLTDIDEDDVSHSCVISRTVTNTGRQTISIIYDDKLLTTKGIKETQDWIEKIFLKASYVLFVNSIASPQENPDNFVKQTAAKKKDLLLEISNIDNYDVYYNKAKDIVSESNNKIIKLETRLEEKNIQLTEVKKDVLDSKSLEQEKDVLQKEVEELKEKITIIEKEKEKLESVVEDIYNKKQSLDNLELSNNNLQSKIDEKNFSIKKFEHLNEKEIKEGVEKLKKAQNRLKEIDEITHNNYLIDLEYRAHLSSKPVDRDFSSDAEQINKQLELIYKNNDIKCPFCGKNNPILEENISKQVDILKEQLAEKVAKREELSKSIIDWELRDATITHPEEQKGVASERGDVLGVISQLEHFYSDLGLLEAKNDALQEVLKDIKYFTENIQKNNETILVVKDELNKLNLINNPKRINILNNESQVLTNEYASKQNDLNSVIRKIFLSDDAQKQVVKLESDIDDCDSELKKIKKDNISMSLLKDAFSPKGIKTIVIDYLVPKLEEKINDILKDLSDFRIQIDTQKTATDEDSVIEGLFINIINSEGNVLEYSNYSGGEKTKIDYAISEALASLSNVKFRILDETVTGLDDQMLSSFLDVLEKMSAGYKQLIAISHISQVKELFEDQVNIIKKDGTSIIN
ncbi:MAG: AAA family ATPase [Candidatus Paceibacterota bacterium]